MKETGFDKWKKKLLFSDALLLFIGLIFLAMLRADKVLVFAYLFALAYLIITKRKKLLYHLILATAISILWLSFSKDLYSYNVEFIRFGSISIFPLLAWALGLFVSYLIYSHFEHKLKNHSF